MNELGGVYPVGAFVVERQNIDVVVQRMRKEGLLKGGTNVTMFRPEAHCDPLQFTHPQSGPLHAVHVVGHIDTVWWTKTFAAAGVPVAYVPGMRVRDAACLPHDSSSSTAATSTTVGSSRMTMIELFAGIGMFRLAGEAVGLTCVFSSEIAPAARWVYDYNFGAEPQGDITEFPCAAIPPHDILTAGFPCQAFSCAGPENGFDDPKGMLFFEVTRVLREKQPAAFLLENVANLAVTSGGTVLRRILDELTECGYVVGYRIIDAAVVVPQRRRRIYFVGFHRRTAVSFDPLLLLHQEGSALQQTCDKSQCCFAWPTTWRPGPRTVRDILEPSKSTSALLLTPQQREMIRNRGRDAIVDLDDVAPTVMGSYRASFQKYSRFVPVDDSQRRMDDVEGDLPTLRFFSVRECARLQGIPDSYSFGTSEENETVRSTKTKKRPFAPNGAYKLVGNAVCPAVVQALLKAIVTALSHSTADAVP